VLGPTPPLFGGALMEPFKLVPRDLAGVATLIVTATRGAPGVSDLTMGSSNWSGHVWPPECRMR
jgi:hypothetical protein